MREDRCGEANEMDATVEAAFARARARVQKTHARQWLLASQCLRIVRAGSRAMHHRGYWLLELVSFSPMVSVKGKFW
jgi:hypothetical protein